VQDVLASLERLRVRYTAPAPSPPLGPALDDSGETAQPPAASCGGDGSPADGAAAGGAAQPAASSPSASAGGAGDAWAAEWTATAGGSGSAGASGAGEAAAASRDAREAAPSGRAAQSYGTREYFAEALSGLAGPWRRRRAVAEGRGGGAKTWRRREGCSGSSVGSECSGGSGQGGAPSRCQRAASGAAAGPGPGSAAQVTSGPREGPPVEDAGGRCGRGGGARSAAGSSGRSAAGAAASSCAPEGLGRGVPLGEAGGEADVRLGQELLMAGELLAIVRPLAYVILLRRYGLGSHCVTQLRVLRSPWVVYLSAHVDCSPKATLAPPWPWLAAPRPWCCQHMAHEATFLLWPFRYGRRSWRPWLGSLAIELLSSAFTARGRHLLAAASERAAVESSATAAAAAAAGGGGGGEGCSREEAGAAGGRRPGRGWDSAAAAGTGRRAAGPGTSLLGLALARWVGIRAATKR
jgi:hypothetical protein